MRVDLVTGSAFTAKQIEEWRELACSAIECNVFYEPWLLLPAMENLASDAELLTLLIYKEGSKDQTGAAQLVGLFPMEQKRRHKGLPVPILELWSHPHSFLCTPLLHNECASEVLECLFDWLQDSDSGYPLIEFQKMTGDGAFHECLVDILYRRKLLNVSSDTYTRAFLKNAGEFSNSRRRKSARKQQANVRRRMKQLKKLGTVEVENLSDTQSLEFCVEQFLDLESRGWKGKEGTAMASTPDDLHFFQELARRSWDTKQSTVLALRLDGRIIALHWSFRSGDGAGAFHFKPTYDEELSNYAPGVLLEAESMRLILEDERVQWMDSCTKPDNVVLNNMWPQRRMIKTITVAAQGGRAHLVISALPMFRWLKGSMRSAGQTTLRSYGNVQALRARVRSLLSG